jgi:general nucleoside transport system ATP-binding protein
MGVVPGDTSRDVLGLMMAGMTAEEALRQDASAAAERNREAGGNRITGEDNR